MLVTHVTTVHIYVIGNSKLIKFYLGVLYMTLDITTLIEHNRLRKLLNNLGKRSFNLTLKPQFILTKLSEYSDVPEGDGVL